MSHSDEPRTKIVVLMEERHPEINNGTIVHYAGLNYFVQEVVEGNRGRIGLRVTEHGH